ncbi:cytochrome c [Echinicola marina]|uniref:c-type cytochrome n=1 Tax=Echinicola marina TaxID=2859768 RepID=UPI001CF6C5A4|nr:cytochrome c [Echinicola marina]UCS95155.1 cytochrome c [Echinicola marina]
MKRFFKIVLYVLSACIVVIGVGIAYVGFGLPNVADPEEIVIAGTADQIARGEYLAHHVMLCMDCHAQRDFSLFSGPPKPNTLGAGGDRFDHSMGFPGVFIAPNITPAGIGDWTDGELFRLITTGVKKDGDPIFPVMPYQSYGKMDPEDIKSVIAYIRTLAPVENELPSSKADFPMNLILNTIPQAASLKPMPPKEDLVKYGEYLVTAGACADCHTNFENGAYTGPRLGGGREFPFPDGTVVRSANLTADETGIGNLTEDTFVALFKKYNTAPFQNMAVKQGEFQTIMPWVMYAGMDSTDLRAIYKYLNSLEPVKNQVEKVSFAN